MNFEQLLDGATKPANKDNISDIVAARTEIMRRLSPAVMREVWAALKLANAPFTDHSDAELQLASEHIAMMTDDPEIHQKAKMAWAVRRALALLDGQTEDKL